MNFRRQAWVGLWLALAAAGGAGAPAADRPDAARPDGRAYVNFNFDQVDIRVLAKLVGEMTGRRFTIDEGVKGKVTVVTPAQIPADEVFPLFLSIIESSGYTVIEKGAVSTVVPLPEKAVEVVPVIGAEETRPARGLITKVIRLEHISAVELRKLLEPMVRGGKTGALSAFGPTNHLIITDTAESIARVEQIVAELDRPGASRAVEILKLKYASADDLADQLNAAVRGMLSANSQISRHIQQSVEGGGALPADVVIVPAPQANSLVVVGTQIQIGEIRRIIGLVDVEPPSGYGRLNAIFLNYLSAEDAAKSLNALLAKTAPKDQNARIAIEPSIENNALIVDAAPRDFQYVQELVKQLDQIPQQVLVEVLIAEVGLNKNLDLGVEWSAVEIPTEDSTTVIGRSRPGETDELMKMVTTGLFPQGLSLGVATGTYKDKDGVERPLVPFLINALAVNKDVKILSNIPLWAQNNTEASVSVVENIPILKSTVEGGSGTARDYIQNIDRMDVGIKLKLTPHVNPDRQVQIELNPSIEAIVDEGEPGKYTPTIAKREVSTTVTVPDVATVAISGLIREDSVKTLSKIPLLGDLPLIGWLFQNRSTKRVRTNLLIFVTPHIVTDAKVAQAMRQRLEKQMDLVNPATNFEAQVEQPVPLRRK